MNDSLSLKVARFKGKQHLLNKMPVYIQNNVNRAVFFFVLVTYAVIVFCFVHADGASNNQKTIAFFVIFALALLFILVHTVKSGAFVMAADENGIYYRIYGRRDEFMLIEWRIICEIIDSYYDDNDRIDVITFIKNNDIPSPCNAVTSKSQATKNTTISFIMPNSKKSAEIKLRLDELRVKNQNAILA
ncbi:MAG: hypothetical protein ABL933_03705 [Methyloglobulus sp.]|nr:hypothetical protein [Methyloglobulus sp.]